MDGTIIFSKGIVFWTTERMDSDEFILFSLQSYLKSKRFVRNHSCGELAEYARVVREKGKKPYLAPKLAEFSLTHTEGFCAVAFSALPVGIDVENRLRFRLRNTSGAQTEHAEERPIYRRIAQRFFGVTVDDEETFFKLWTKREAEAKRDETFLFEESADLKGNTEYFKVGDFLIAVAYS